MLAACAQSGEGEGMWGREYKTVAYFEKKMLFAVGVGSYNKGGVKNRFLPA